MPETKPADSIRMEGRIAALEANMAHTAENTDLETLRHQLQESINQVSHKVEESTNRISHQMEENRVSNQTAMQKEIHILYRKFERFQGEVKASFNMIRLAVPIAISIVGIIVAWLTSRGAL